MDALNEEERRQREAEWLRRQSSVVQRGLPRPFEVNRTVLRPVAADQPSSELLRAEELIKEEMLVMLHHDLLHNNTTGAPVPKSEATAARQYLERHPYTEVEPEELAEVSVGKAGCTLRAGVHSGQVVARPRTPEGCRVFIL